MKFEHFPCTSSMFISQLSSNRKRPTNSHTHNYYHICKGSFKMKVFKIPVHSTLISFIAIFSLLISTSFAYSSNLSSSSEESSEQNVQRVNKDGPLTVVEVKIPDKSKLDLSFPHLKFVNDSSESRDENERIAKDGKMISGVASKFGKRSVRGYYPSSSRGGMMMMGGNPYNSRYTRFDSKF